MQGNANSEQTDRDGLGKTQGVSVRPVWVFLLASALLTLVLSRFDAFELIHSYVKRHEELELDEFILAAISFLLLVPLYHSYSMRRALLSERQAMRSLERHDELLASIAKLHSLYMGDKSIESIFDIALSDILRLTGSSYGYISELQTDDAGCRFQQALAISNIAWEGKTRHFYDENAPSGFRFYEFDGLNAAAIMIGKVVIANDPVHDSRSHGRLPEGHPSLDAFMGLPLYRGKEIIGSIGLANRQGGYDEALAAYLMPLVESYAQLIEAYRMGRSRQSAERMARESNERLRTITNSAKDAIIVMDERGRVDYWNPAAETIFGYTEKEILGKNLHETLAPGSYQQAYDHGTKIFQREGTGPVLGKTLELEAVHKDGREFPIELTVNSLSIKGKPYAVSVLRDITLRKKHEQRLQKSEMAYRDLVGHMNDGLVSIDTEGMINFTNKAFMEMVGREHEDDIVHHHASEFSHPDCVQDVRQMIEHDMTSGIMREEIETKLVRADGREVFVQVRMSPFLDERDVLIGATAVVRDITDHKKAEEEIEYRATYDNLTGLFNREMMLQLLESLLAQGKRHGFQIAVLFIDLDEFKLVNDTLGHDAGDDLLAQVAQRLSGVLRESDVLARHGGDEFVLLMSNLGEEDSESNSKEEFIEGVTHVAQRIIAMIQEPFLIKEQQAYVGASIGISIYPDDGKDKMALLQHADSAMYQAKESGRGAYHYYSQELFARQEKRVSVANQLHKAIEEAEFVLYYQPIVDLSNAKMIGVEALVRWVRDGEIVPPSEFISIAETSGLIVPIGDWVLEESCAQLCAWEKESIRLYVAVNLSVRQFWQGDITAKVLETVSKAGVDKNLLELEVTESAMTKDVSHMEKVLEDFRLNGLRISLDDFGTGYSSLNRLKHLPISKLKIDQSFVSGVPQDEDDMAIVKAIIQMSSSLGVDTLAEGIETLEQWRFLRELGCQYGQGYYFSHPVPADDIKTLWYERSGILAQAAL